MSSGYLTVVVAIAAVVIAFVVKPMYNALRYSSWGLLALAVLQGLLGFAAEISDRLVRTVLRQVTILW